MAEAAAGAVVEEVVKCAVPPIKRGFNYLCCFTSNINNMKDEAEKLEAVAKGIQMKVDGALANAEVILPEVTTFLEDDYKDIKAQMTAILDQVPNAGSVCLNVGARFSLSKRATKTAETMKKLKEQCSKYSIPETAISLARPPPAREAIPLRNAYEFESRKQIEEEIMALLRGGDVRMIGIRGMGGLGKTTMAKRIMNRVFNEHVFEETVFAVVSQNVDKRKIQCEISGSLGLKLEENESDAVTEQKLRARLSDTKKTLLVLDDVWEPIELEEFGIPLDSKGCTILITSRDRHVLQSMHVEEFGMEILSDEDARILFRMKVGTCMDDAKVKSIAEGIVKMCGGLPIALATVGAALKDKSARYWSNALSELSQRLPDHIDGYIAKVFNPLRLSYDLLSSDQDKFVFLLCCLFPEDANIDVEKLICFGMGLGIFKGIRDLEDVRLSMTATITMLRGRSLLLDGEESDHRVRMHGVVRHVCKIIATRDKYIGDDCQWISSIELVGERTEHPTGLGSQNLSLLFLCRSYMSEQEEAFKLDSSFFEGINGDLSVLCIEGYMTLTSLPLTQSLKHLKSLVLHSCDKLKTILFVGELVNLEILICRSCSLIEELPLEIKQLNHLKLLELQRIGQGIISSLLGLEELKMLGSFTRWESERREKRENAGLRELEALTKLRCLEIEIEDCALAAEMIHLPSKITRFGIEIGKCWGGSGHPYDKRLFLGLYREESRSENSISMQLLRDTEYLYLRGNGANSVDLAKCLNIRKLEFMRCDNVKNIFTTSFDVDDATASIEHLILSYLPKLETICDGPISSNSFNNLKELNLSSLKTLKQVWKSSQNIFVPPLFTNLSSNYISVHF